MLLIELAVISYLGELDIPFSVVSALFYSYLQLKINLSFADYLKTNRHINDTKD